ncbi:CCA tRNA nucleotidyltransferase [Alteriqipengyuania lutimaris]|uniref:CCA tRNA nucleotidyltransferase n=1 Tax=Alteriqipengyuania lutimaris TaxID=1538146 RepID=A0A395LL06_9SPHN|nr:CCA tRNA nucleotidyltransferase [Alteriqipengyuania lutimaris]MBB3033305.1 poly(A) polymerase [Alteriqipengyuania lutimaris]RDS77658.1 CCA tRNA nucleotidyltransferase [Alteriqipengyuania lutimaris]
MAERLPEVQWTQREDLAALVAALGADNLRWVGGAVRDTLLGLPVKDIDAATPLRPEQVVERCAAAGIKTVPTGIAHGTITTLPGGGPVEVTTLRHDVSSDGRRATVAFASDWREDAARRDFTINALYADPNSLELFDYFGGLQDLEARCVRFIGDPDERIREDHLRILRYYRFQARFGSDLDEPAENACARLAPTMKGLSRERVAMELLAILALPDPAPTIARMQARGVLPVILPETGTSQIAALERLIACECEHDTTGTAIVRLAALLPAADSIAESVAARLRLSRQQRGLLMCLAERRESDGDAPKALAYEHGRDCASGRLLLMGGDPHAIAHWEIPQLPLKGGEIVAHGVTGADVSRLLRQVEARWIAEDFPDRARVLNLLETALAERA